MKLFRKRWWAVYAIAPWCILGFMVTIVVVIIRILEQNYFSAITCMAIGYILFILFMILYAPYTFHNAMRIMLFIISLGFCGNFIYFALNGDWTYPVKSRESAINALLAFITLGIPALSISIFYKKPKNNPYRKDGTLRKPLIRELVSSDGYAEE